MLGSAFAGGADDCGTLFEVAPPSEPGAPWSYSLMYSFKCQADGGHPTGVIASGRVIYGAANDGGSASYGTVFELPTAAVSEHE